MLKIGVTGGIGSGKSVVCTIFKQLGIPIFNADIEAKRIMVSNQNVVNQIKLNFGDVIYNEDSSINKKKLADIIFTNKEALKIINSIIHPEVKNEFEYWACLQNSKPYVIEESAILFESGAYKNFDKIISVISPIGLRIMRVIARDGVTKNQVLSRMNSQISDDEKIKLSDYIVYNDDSKMLIPQILDLHSKLIK
ncbi:MAG TPA: dephospho-CoA kinase [Bacteroidales bacterium]|nr:MAG: dephospho-CoA kinase [Bacteroidetes bacterium GWF2_33_38]OFY90889.1 MAG: dephospho-CoA kinase [Bacteroidetes bacterium RIFOXYA2_FULL_33_7]HBF88366.1 dephospho-CoA kinase [Bacteroidales bacterium]